MRLLIKAFGLLLSPVSARFHRSLQNPKAAQDKVHQELVDRLIKSGYGQHWGIQAVADWDRLPIVNYEDLRDWIDDHSEPILFYEKTSGSRGAAKLIPYTKSLRRSFSQMFCVWAQDLIQHVPFQTGQVYFCVSPKFNTPLLQSSLQDDSDYLDPWLTPLIAPFLITLPNAQNIQDPIDFKHKLALRLIQAEKLEIISIWNPSFLTVILDYIGTHRNALKSELDIAPDRLQLLGHPEIPWQKLWPHLKLISCWDAAGAAEQAKALRSRFPDVFVQGKGLLATEAPMTVPLISAKGCVPVLDEVFFEFEDEIGQVWRLHELQIGQEYQLIISQKGGFYRYRIGDRILVTHFYQQTPCLEFLGRSGGISDLVGEKLNPDFVRDVLQQLDLPAGFKTLVPMENPAHYVLLLDSPIEQSALERLADRLEQSLCQAYHYAQARSLGQLQPAVVITHSDMADRWAKLKMAKGMRWGDIKDEILVSCPIDLHEINL